MKKLFPSLSVLFLISFGFSKSNFDVQVFEKLPLLSKKDYQYKFIGEEVEFVKTDRKFLEFYQSSDYWINSEGKTLSYKELMGKRGILDWIKMESVYGGRMEYRWYKITLNDGRQLYCKDISTGISPVLTPGSGFIPRVYVLSEHKKLEEKYIDKSIWLNEVTYVSSIFPELIPFQQNVFNQKDEVIVKEVIPYGGPEPYYFFRIESKDGENTCFIKVSRFEDELDNYFVEDPSLNPLLFYNGDPCSEISRQVDRFDNQVTIRSPLIQKITYSKIIEENKEYIYLSIRIPGRTLNTGLNGVILLLKSGEKVSWKNQRVDTNYNSFSDTWEYSSFTLLDNEMINKLIKDPITDVKLFIYDSSIENPEKFSSYLECIVGMR